MARAFSAKKSKAGKAIKCGRCGKAIEPGQKYYYFSTGFRGAKQIRCAEHPPRTSELTGNEAMSAVYAAIEGVEDVLASPTVTISDIASALETAAGEVEQAQSDVQDSYDNLPENFQNGDTGQQMQEKIDAMTDFASSLQSAAEDVAEMENDVEDEEKLAEENLNAPDDILQNAKDKAEEVLQEFSL